MVACLLLLALGAGPVELRLKATEFSFGDPFVVDVQLVNSGDARGDEPSHWRVRASESDAGANQ